MDYQKVVLVGNVTQDAQKRTSKKSKVTFTSFGLAVRDGGEHPTYFSPVIFGSYGEAIAKYLTRGCQVLVEGRLTAGKDGRLGLVAERIVLGLKKANTARDSQKTK